MEATLVVAASTLEGVAAEGRTRSLMVRLGSATHALSCQIQILMVAI